MDSLQWNLYYLESVLIIYNDYLISMLCIPVRSLLSTTMDMTMDMTMEDECLYELLFSGSSLFDDEVGLNLSPEHVDEERVQGARTAPSDATKNILINNEIRDEDITKILKKKRKKSKKKNKGCVEFISI